MSPPTIFVLDTDIGYDPDDIMALQILALYVKNPINNARLMVVSSAERYNVEDEMWFKHCFRYYSIKDSTLVQPGHGIQTLDDPSVKKALAQDTSRKNFLIGKRAQILYWLVKNLGFQVVSTIQKLQEHCECVLVVSGLPGYVGDPAAAKTRQYSTFLQQQGSNYRQAVVPELYHSAVKDWNILPNDKNNIIDLHQANTTMVSAIQDIENPLCWIGIGSMCNIACFYWQAHQTAKKKDDRLLQKLHDTPIFQMAMNVPFNKKYVSTNTFLDPMSVCYMNSEFKGELHFVSSLLTSKYRWTSPMGYYDSQIRTFLEDKQDGKHIFPKQYTALAHLKSDDTRDASEIVEEAEQLSTSIDYPLHQLKSYVKKKSSVYKDILSQTDDSTGKPKFEDSEVEASMIGALFTLTSRFLWQDNPIFKKAVLANLYNKYGKLDGGEKFGRNTCSHFVFRDEEGDEKEFLMGPGVPKEQQVATIELISNFIQKTDSLQDYLISPLQHFVTMNLADFFAEIEKAESAETGQSAEKSNKIKQQIVNLCSYIYPKPSEYWPFESSFHDPLTVLFAISHITTQTPNFDNLALKPKLRRLHHQLYQKEKGICREVKLSLSEPYGILENITLFQEDTDISQEDVSLIYRNAEEFASHNKKGVPVVDIKEPLEIPMRIDDVFLWNCKESMAGDKTQIPFKTTLDVDSDDSTNKY